MFLGSRTTRSSREQREEMKMSAHGSRTDEELQHWQRIHTTSSALDSMRSTNTSGDLHKVGGGMERERALQQFGSSGKIYPTGGTLLAGMAAGFTLMFLWGINPLAQLERLWSSYLNALALAPLLTKMCTAGVCTLVGDTLAQVLPFLLKSSHSSDAAAQKGSSTVDGGSGAAGKPGSGAPSGGLDQRSNSLKHPVEAPANPTLYEHSSQGGLLPGFKYDPARAARFLLFSVLLATPVAHQWFNFLDKVILPDAPTSPLAVVLKMMSDQFLMTPFMTSVFFAVMTTLEGHPDRALTTVKDKIKPTLKANYLLWPAAHLVNFGLVPLDLRILYINIVAIGWTVYLSSAQASKSA
eukprot:CAMPEP_0202374400 /NCGR_PEP_ID=MMETSP1127-20130417/5236_1 /ASSEMBLY_ACC=CAM_ASM_000462 /TAXON_ID=3047 /ORGANISM="Dunaliella tertiolecta, Strain CCMP1320" /LENGTH=352 /DNA_ID=CAMNT_0048971543 /DNA_START=240 /DNA_END=1298 /DNA_ORIENTATION=+